MTMDLQPKAVTREQIIAGIQVIRAVGAAIQELGEVASGVLYARIMPLNVSEETYRKIIDRLTGAGLVRESGAHLLTWIGPPARRAS